LRIHDAADFASRLQKRDNFFGIFLITQARWSLLGQAGAAAAGSDEVKPP
jgi:hypothetical protein